MHTKKIIVGFAVFIFISACNVNDSFDQEKAQIIFGKEINGITLGDEQRMVFRSLGEPSSSLAFALTGGRFFYGDSLIITTYLLPDSELEAGENLGKFTGVTNIEIQSSFRGKTEDGIGIGSLRTEVVASLGKPKLSTEDNNDSTSLTDYYLLKGSELAFLYQNGQIMSISYSFPNVLKEMSE